VALGRPEIIVPGFPEIITFQPKCRVCQLARTKSGLVEIIHRYRREDKLGVVAIANRIREMLERHGETPMHDQVLARHFKNHVAFDEAEENDILDDIVALREDDEARLEEAFVELIEVDHEAGALGQNDSDYHHMWDLFRRVYRRVAALDADQRAFITDEGILTG
jgi:hypothetical protein